MTAAVCIACGAVKVGAWTACPVCDHEPLTDTGRARAILLSDHNGGSVDLEAASAALNVGRPVTYDEGAVRTRAVSLESIPDLSWRAKLLIVVGLGLFWAAVTAVIIVVIAGVRWAILG